MPGAAPRILAQLGYDYPWDERGGGGPVLLDELAWGAHAAEPGTLAAPSPLFPRLEIEAPDAPSAPNAPSAPSAPAPA